MRLLTVDAMTTGYAFVRRDLLAKEGVSNVSFARTGGVADRFRDMLADPPGFARATSPSGEV